MPGPVFLRGDRVSLHVADESDLEFVTRWRNHPDVRRWMPRSRPETPDDTEEFYDGFVKGDDDSGVCLLACEDAEPLGLVSLFLVDADSRRGRMGAWLRPDAQGEGYGTEAASLLVEYAFAERNLRKLVANARADNEPSRGTLEKLGFTEEGRQREHYFLDGEYVDRVIYGLFAHEWREGSSDGQSAIP
jgi:RimJ/RimL family protein N-acetyltransferase